MLSKKAVFLVCCIVPFAYWWLKYVKQGPVYKTGKNLSGKTVLITGGNTGIGKAAAIEFAKLGAKVVIASRNVATSERAVKEIVTETKNDNVHFYHLDLEDYDSIRDFAEKFDKSEDHLDYLINNAGVIGLEGVTDRGFNRMFAINYLGHFLLTNLLLEKMKKQSKSRPVRVINLSSDTYKLVSGLDYGKMTRDTKGPLDSFSIYGNSKVAINLFTLELHRRLADYDITTYSVHPGNIGTDIENNFPPYFARLNGILMSAVYRTPYYGAQTIMYCALDDDVVEHSGDYFKNCRREELWPYSKDQTVGRKLWEESLKMTDLARNRP